MPINLSVYSETEQVSRNVTFDIRSNILAEVGTSPSSLDVEYYYIFTTNGRDSQGNSVHPKVVKDLSTDPNGSPASYSNITEMVEDYTKWFSEQIDFSR